MYDSKDKQPTLINRKTGYIRTHLSNEQLSRFPFAEKYNNTKFGPTLSQFVAHWQYLPYSDAHINQWTGAQAQIGSEEAANVLIHWIRTLNNRTVFMLNIQKLTFGLGLWQEFQDLKDRTMGNLDLRSQFQLAIYRYYYEHEHPWTFEMPMGFPGGTCMMISYSLIIH